MSAGLWSKGGGLIEIHTPAAWELMKAASGSLNCACATAKARPDPAEWRCPGAQSSWV